MRIAPNHPRLRIVAVACMSVGGWLLLQPGMLALHERHTLFTIFILIAACIVLALGIAFWLIGTDHRAGIHFDSKGLMLNLGDSAAFVGWDNIAAIGISYRRDNLFAIGSNAQLGIRLRRPAEYLQSYEARLPASNGFLAQAVRLTRRSIAALPETNRLPTLETLENRRRSTGYDLLIPEAQLGGRAEAFLKLIDVYRR